METDIHAGAGDQSATILEIILYTAARVMRTAGYMIWIQTGKSSVTPQKLLEMRKIHTEHYHVSGAQSAIPVNAWASCGPMLKRGNGQHYSAYRLLYRGPSCLLTGPTIRDADADRQTLNRQFET